jgi:hypothetical protein
MWVRVLLGLTDAHMNGSIECLRHPLEIIPFNVVRQSLVVFTQWVCWCSTLYLLNLLCLPHQQQAAVASLVCNLDSMFVCCRACASSSASPFR